MEVASYTFIRKGTPSFIGWRHSRSKTISICPTLRIADYIRELLPPGVFDVVIGGHDLWPWATPRSGIDVVTVSRSVNRGKPELKSVPGTLEPVTLELRGNDSRTAADADPEEIAVFGSIAASPSFAVSNS